MRFHENVKAFEFANHIVIGNLTTGYVIGLNEKGVSICMKLFHSDCRPEEIQEVDPELFKHLELGSFFKHEPQGESLKGAYLHVTQRCNLDCVGCYSFDEKRNKYQDPNLSKMISALDFLGDMNIQSLIISGGEPFLRNDLPEIIDYAYTRLRIPQISIITNGTYADDDVLTSLKGKVIQIGVSIDGYSSDCIPHIRRVQRFDTLTKTIQKIKTHDINVHIIPTIHRRNYQDIQKYIALSKTLGTTMNFSLLSAPTDNIEAQELLPNESDLRQLGMTCLSSLKDKNIAFLDTPLGLSLCARKSCGLSKSIISIDSDGEIYPCHMLHTKEFSMGNVYQDNPDNILASEIRKALLSSHVDEYSECCDCSIKYLCGGGCRARAYFASGSLLGKDSYCEMIKTFYKGYEESIMDAKTRKRETPKTL